MKCSICQQEFSESDLDLQDGIWLCRECEEYVEKADE